VEARARLTALDACALAIADAGAGADDTCIADRRQEFLERAAMPRGADDGAGNEPRRGVAHLQTLDGRYT
jgi:hypothetical protein